MPYIIIYRTQNTSIFLAEYTLFEDNPVGGLVKKRKIHFYFWQLDMSMSSKVEDYYYISTNPRLKIAILMVIDHSSGANRIIVFEKRSLSVKNERV